MHKVLGNHLIIEYYDCDYAVLNDVNAIESIMLEAANLAKATIIDSVFHKFSPQGVSGVVVIAESHLSIHTFPELNYAAVDVFTCGNIDYMIAHNYLKLKLHCNNCNVKVIKRGIIND